MITKEQIQEATKRLVEVYQPEAIYLFGSYAWGEPDEDSDIDLMIVVEDDVNVEWTAYKKGKWAIRDLKITNDILVENKKVFKDRAKHPSMLEHEIITKGQKLYENTRSMNFHVS
jgi:uncharacterized protein